MVADTAVRGCVLYPGLIGMVQDASLDILAIAHSENSEGPTEDAGEPRQSDGPAQREAGWHDEYQSFHKHRRHVQNPDRVEDAERNHADQCGGHPRS